MRTSDSWRDGLCLLGTLKQPGEDVGYDRQVSHHSRGQDLGNRGEKNKTLQSRELLG